MTRNKHAKEMLQYAEDACEEMNPYIRWECRAKSIRDEWSPWIVLSSHPNWCSNMQYRRKAKWEPKGGHQLIMSNGEVTEVLQTSINDTMARLFGMKRATQEQAVRAAREMGRFNRLLALADEFNEEGEPLLYFLYYEHLSSTWEISIVVVSQQIITPIFTRRAATIARNMLNNNEAQI
jgi:hypothetical protein